VEQAHGSALAHYVHWTEKLGSPVLIKGTWYKAWNRLACGLYIANRGVGSGEGFRCGRTPETSAPARIALKYS
jgi:hypothetical protein